MDVAKYGTPEWKPISETRHARLVKFAIEEPDSSFRTLKWGFVCYGCDYPRHMGADAIWCADLADALISLHKHDWTHETNIAECCMYATGSVCRCGKELV